MRVGWLLALALAPSLVAGQDRAAGLELSWQRMRERLSGGAPWLEDYRQARAEARRRGALLLLYLATPAHRGCARLERELFARPAFAAWAAERGLVLAAWLRGTGGPPLARLKGAPGYPGLLFLDGDGCVLAMAPVGELEALEAARGRAERRRLELAELAARARHGDAMSARLLLVERVAARAYDSEAELLAALDALALGPEARAVYAERVFGERVRLALARVDDRAAAARLGRRFAALALSGRVPADDLPQARAFWWLVAHHALASGCPIGGARSLRRLQRLDRQARALSALRNALSRRAARRLGAAARGACPR